MAVLAALILVAGCPDEDAGDGDNDYETDGACDTEGAPPAGDWDPQLVDWSDVAEPGYEGDQSTPGVCGTDYTEAHHCFLTAVHAIHLPTGQMLMYHGQQDERVWDIGSSAETMTWHPDGPAGESHLIRLGFRPYPAPDCGIDRHWEGGSDGYT